MAKRLVKTYDGKTASVSWHGKLCIHVAECGRAKGELFEGGRDPWCDPDAASSENVREVVERCPTGALSVTFSDGTASEISTRDNTITVVYSGPLILRGELEIDDAPEDAPGLAFRAALCRCGQSRNKPYCDNSHAKTDFKDYGAVGDTGSLNDTDSNADAEPNASQGGPLKVSFVENGPVRLSGNMSIIAGSGRTAWQGESTALCRCGLSNNKPFCDGSHRAAEWKSD